MAREKEFPRNVAGKAAGMGAKAGGRHKAESGKLRESKEAVARRVDDEGGGIFKEAMSGGDIKSFQPIEHKDAGRSRELPADPRGYNGMAWDYKY